VLLFGAGIGEDFPQAQIGSEVFASTVILDKAGAAQLT
jgi:hypothetical protein